MPKPIGALQTICIWPFTGTGLYARNCADAPVDAELAGIHMTQISAEPEVVPDEVIDAALDP